ncbi:TetR/AcrR family transcriptional regulator [Tyzzerella sp. OttesenSCG-928-J15]|nr:TetR/AcrR family transcriptional regulator [Tyzzerella sp. OttesenSCG-928-J15]
MPSIEYKNLQRNQTMSYFINAALELVKEEGLSNLSIRKIADKAGYNSATLYHYFLSFEEICIYASMKFVDGYIKDLPNYLKQAETPLYKYLKTWECFCYHSFNHPEEFWLLFFKKKSESGDFTKYFERYYEIFPESLSEEVEEYKAMLIADSIYERDYILLDKSLNLENNRVSSEIMYKINEMNILIYRGMLSSFRDAADEITPEEATSKTIEYMSQTLKSYGISF